MTRRVVYLVEEGDVEASRILALTFSRAAAQELRERLEALIGAEGERPVVSTLHAFALRQLIRNAGAPTLPAPIQIADDYDERWVIQEEIASLTGMSVKGVQREFQNLAADWETLRAEEDVWERQHPVPAFLGAWRRHREVYGYTLRAELVYALKKALDQDLDFELERDFLHVLVDEYQDLNRCEIQVLQRVVGEERQLFVAGDDDQSIYGFRNAFPLGLREFAETYPDAAEGELVECHRCDREILRMALNVAEQDPDRIPKELRPLDEAEEGDVQVFGFRNQGHEAAGIARICRSIVDADVRPGSILILLRSDPGGIYSTPIVEALAAEGLAGELPSNPFAILDHPQPRQLVCLLRLLRHRGDGLAWRELLKLRNNSIGDGTLFAVYRLADDRGFRYAAALDAVRVEPALLDHRMRNRLAEAVEEVDLLLEALAPIMDTAAEDGLGEAMVAIELEDPEREEVGDLLLGLVADDEEATVRDLVRALQTRRGSRDEAEQDQQRDGIQIMTMHAAKGLTAEAVIVAACEDELIPGANLERRDLDDQRRLLYVSLTRAQHHLLVTFAAYRPGQQSYRLQVPPRRTFTRFLRDYVDPRLV